MEGQAAPCPCYIGRSSVLRCLGQSPFMPLVLAYLLIAPAFTLPSVPIMMMDYAVMESDGRFQLGETHLGKIPLAAVWGKN